MTLFSSKQTSKRLPKTWWCGIFGVGLLGVMFGIKQVYLPTSLVQNTVQTPKYSTIIQAKDYQQFWLWTPPKDSEKLRQATTLYILQGEIRTLPNANLARLISQGLGVRALKDKQIWLVFRANNQAWANDVIPQLLSKIQRWEQTGNHIVGIQIDFDAPTYRLDNYVAMLKLVRKQLPNQYQLSVTGLLDWANQADNPQFIELGQTVDELVMQTYQGTTTITNYPQYLKKLQQVPFPFKVGIVEGGVWQGADYLENNPNFKGYVVFLR